uniref:SAM domain-containing protein n=1 Tax=Dunaliella tertiolecta TaxID=3047 RepID=A0A6S8HD74_DUNTE
MGQVLCCKAEAKEDEAGKQEPSAAKNEEEGPADIIQRLSRSYNPAYSWLAELGLERYAAAFVNAGFDDWSLLSILDDNDLALIEMHNDLTILPGHRKKLLLAAKQMSCKDPALAKRRRQMRSSRRSMSNRISPLQPGAFDLAASQLSTGANSKARKQLDAQGAALQRRASLVDRALTQPQDQLQEALARPQSSPELPLNEDMGKGRYPALEFEKQASKQGMRGRRSSSGSGNRSRSSTNSSVTITSASNADRMEGPGCSARHNAHSPSQQEDAEPQQQQQQQQQHKECDVPSQQQGQQVEQLQSAQGQHHQHRECGVLSQKPTSFQHQHAESMHVDVRAPRPNVPSPLPAMPLLTKQTSSGRRHVPMGTIPIRSSSRARQNNNPMPSGHELAEPGPERSPAPAFNPPQSHGQHQPQRPSQRSPSPAASRRAEDPLPSHVRPAWETGKEPHGIPRQAAAQDSRPSGRKVWAAAGQHADRDAGAAAASGHKRPWSCPSGQQQERQQQGQQALQQQQRGSVQGGSIQGPSISDITTHRSQSARPLSPMHDRPSNVTPRSHVASPHQYHQHNSGLHSRPPNSRSSSARSQKTLAVPVKADDETSPWNQDLALCIAGAAYVPKLGGQQTGSSNPVYEHQPSSHQQGWSRSPVHPPLTARNVLLEPEARSPSPTWNPPTNVGLLEHLHVAGTSMQVSSNPAYAPSRNDPVPGRDSPAPGRNSPAPGREKRRRAAYVQTPPPPIQMQPTLSSSSSSSFASSGDTQTLDPSALAEIIGPDTIQNSRLANGRVEHSVQSVTLGNGLGIVGGGELQQVAKHQKGASRAASPESRLVARKLEAILHGLELKGIGRGKPKMVERHSSKRAELQQLHAQVEAQLERLRHPPAEANAQHATPPVPVAGDPDLREIEQRIAKKLNELEAQLAQG